jgi:hypothetical protein
MEEKMSDNLAPDDRFVERLEWQLGSEFRRIDRLRPARGKIAVPRRLAAAALMVGVLMTGVTVIKAAEYIQDSWRKKIEIARVETEVRLKEALNESAKQSAVRTEHLAALGLIREDESLAAKRAVEKSELALKKSKLNQAEVMASGGSPRDEVFARKAAGRDFVSERLAIEKKQAELDLAALENRLSRIRQLSELGLISKEERISAAAETTAQKAAIDKIQKRLDLRKDFLAGKATAQEVDIKDRLAVAEENMLAAKAKADSLRENMKKLEERFQLGLVSPMIIENMKTALVSAEAESKLAALEMEVLEKVK